MTRMGEIESQPRAGAVERKHVGGAEDEHVQNLTGRLVTRATACQASCHDDNA